MDVLVDLLEYDLPLWVVVILQLVAGMGKLWTGVRRVGGYVRSANSRLKESVRQWLGVHETVFLTQDEFDQLPSNAAKAVYMVREEPGNRAG